LKRFSAAVKGLGKLHKENLTISIFHEYCFRVNIKEKKMDGQAAGMEQMKPACKLLFGKPEVSLGELGVEGKIILKRIVRKYSMWIWAGFIWYWLFRTKKHLLCSVRCRHYLERQSNC
jgi:hypothetical protein